MDSTTIIGLILGSNVITALLTIWANKALRKSETKSNEAVAAETLGKTYSALIKSMNDEIARLRKINEDLEKQKTDLDKHKNELITKIHDLETEVDELRKTVTKLTAKLKKYENGK